MKLILTCIYMRTLLEYEDTYLSSKLLTKIYYKVVLVEKKLAKCNKALYTQCLKVASIVWLSFKATEDLKIRIEPYLTNLYFSNKAEFIKQKFKPAMIDKLMEAYYNKHLSKLEKESRNFSEGLMDETIKTLQGYLSVSDN